MSAYDPNRTLSWTLTSQNLKRYDALVDLGGRREAARISSLCGWCGCGMACSSACAAARPVAADRRAAGPCCGRSGSTNVRCSAPARTSGGGLDRRAKCAGNAAELVALNPDVIVAGYGPTGTILHGLTRTVPVVFAQAIDPVGAGFVESLARPGGNLTGFTQFEYGISVKWLELLKEIAPHISRVGVVRNAQN